MNVAQLIAALQLLPGECRVVRHGGEEVDGRLVEAREPRWVRMDRVVTYDEKTGETAEQVMCDLVILS